MRERRRWLSPLLCLLHASASAAATEVAQLRTDLANARVQTFEELADAPENEALVARVAALELAQSQKLECVVIITTSISEENPCRLNRLKAIVSSSGSQRDVTILHAANGTVSQTAVRGLQALNPRLQIARQPASVGVWRFFGGKVTGYSKAAFVNHLLHDPRAKQCDRAWQVEDDVFFTGRWEALFDAHSGSAADLVATSGPNDPAHLDPTAAKCYTNKTTVCAPPWVVIWPLLRMSRNLALEIASVLSPARHGKGFHEFLTGVACKQAAWGCSIAPFVPSVIGYATVKGSSRCPAS